MAHMSALYERYSKLGKVQRLSYVDPVKGQHQSHDAKSIPRTFVPRPFNRG